MIAPIIKGLVLGLILSISVGPVIFAIIKQSLTNGYKAGYIFVAGVSLSDMTLVFICNFFTSFFALALLHKAFIALLGAGFLLVMGVYTLFFKKIVFEFFQLFFAAQNLQRILAHIFHVSYITHKATITILIDLR